MAIKSDEVEIQEDVGEQKISIAVSEKKGNGM